MRYTGRPARIETPVRRTLHLRAAMLLALVPLVGACSWITEFFVANRSPRSLVVTWTIPPMPLSSGREHCELDPSRAGPPVLLPASKVKRSDTSKHSDPATDYSFDERTCSITLTLPPSKAVRVGSIPVYGRGRNEHRAWGFPVRLILRDGENTAAYEGPQLDRLFKRRSRTVYVLRYGGS